MRLIERDGFLLSLEERFTQALRGEGHTVFVCGEAGIGKTSLVKTFSRSVDKRCAIFLGSCEALFTPSPLAPVYDILFQISKEDPAKSNAIRDRSVLFNTVMYALRNLNQASIVIIDDIHWADEATLDFIKFLARRISQLRCLFLLTYRDNEIHLRHPLRNVLGQLTPGSFTKMELPPLSKEAVYELAAAKGLQGENIYSISGGNPFYVNEMLQSYTAVIPDNIRDSILSAFNACNEKTKQVWQMVSVLPSALELKYLEKMLPHYSDELAICLEKQILVIEKNAIAFKHELFRRVIETTVSPLQKINLHKRILEILLPAFEEKQELERIVHHAKNANEREWVLKYAPIAARKAAALGAHQEASKLFLTAIEYDTGDNQQQLLELYEAYVYECYLTSQIPEAIHYQEKVLAAWLATGNAEKIGKTLRFLSRLWWFAGNRKNAVNYAEQAIQVLKDEPASDVKAMAFSNMSQLKMLADEVNEAVYWGNQAIEMAKASGNQEILSHALNNVGSSLMIMPGQQDQAREMLEQSLSIAVTYEFSEHAARSYTNLGSVSVKLKWYDLAEKMLNEGIRYCEERDLYAWSAYMLSWKARLLLEKGKWEEAAAVAETLLGTIISPPTRNTALVVLAQIKLRKGEEDALPLLEEAKSIAFATAEIQRIAPVLTAFLEFEWITGKQKLLPAEIDQAVSLVLKTDNHLENSAFMFWLWKARHKETGDFQLQEDYRLLKQNRTLEAAACWKKLGCPYESALALATGDDENKKEAPSILLQLGAEAVYEKLKQQWRNEGLKNLPRGKRQSTKNNPGQLTDREMAIVKLLHKGMQNKEIAGQLFISPKTVDHHISSILFKLDVNSRSKAAQEAVRLGIIKES